MMFEGYRPSLLQLVGNLILWAVSFGSTLISVHQLPLDMEGQLLHMALIIFLLLAVYVLTHTQNNYKKGCLKVKFGWSGDDEIIQAYKGSKTNFIMAWLFLLIASGVFGTLLYVSKLSTCSKNAFGAATLLLTCETYHLITIVRRRIDANDYTYTRHLKKKV